MAVCNLARVVWFILALEVKFQLGRTKLDKRGYYQATACWHIHWKRAFVRVRSFVITCMRILRFLDRLDAKH